MAELLGVELPRNHPLESRTAALAAVGVAVEPFVPMVNVRGESGLAPNTWVPAGDGYRIWLGPDETLVTHAGDTDGTDVSAQRITLRLTGDRARAVLAKGCAIDLHPRVFTRGRCAQTRLAQAVVILLSLEGDEYLVLVRSSFAGYLADWLLDASLEFGEVS